MMTVARSPHPYLPYIDGLRAIAVAAVVIYHLHGDWLPGGFAGVDVFFVISGFVVSASLAARERTSFRSFGLYFIARRLQRIAPALIVCLLVTTLVCALLIPDAWLSEGNERTGRYAFFGLSNVVLARGTNSYFSPISEYNPYTHTWSLGVEEQFYLLFPLLFWTWTFGGYWRRLVTGMFVVLGAASFLYALHLRDADALSAFYLLPSRFWELAIGVVLYQGMTLTGRRFDVAETSPYSSVKAVAAVSGCALMAYGFITGAATNFPAPGAIAPVLGTALVLAALHGQPLSSSIARLLTSPPMRRLGAMSYSLYLWHWPVLVVFRWTCGLDTPLKMTAAVALALALAYLSWRFVENPVRSSSRIRTMPRWQVVALGAAILFVGMRLHRFIDAEQGAWSLSTVSRHAADWYPTSKNKRDTVAVCGVPKPRVDTVGEGVRISYVRSACPEPVNAPDVFVIGDSHAMAFGSMFDAYAERTGARVTLYNNGGCAFLSLQPDREDSVHCRVSTESAVGDILRRVKPGDVIFLPSLRMPRFVDQWVRYPRDQVLDSIFGERAAAARESASKVAVAMLDRLRSTHARIVVEAPNLLLNAPAYRCADAWTRANPLCVDGTAVDRAEFERLREPMLKAVDRLAAQVHGTSVFDPFPLLCRPGPTCDGYLDGHPLFFDGDHVSAYGNRVLLPAFVAAMRLAAGPLPDA
ncbi:peptidoglycan/LPS O-acetylase OafA/YrhL [Luteibacter jiangsuensis]|uniref:Peptidoglycan/LPS O-acetylase OafA/YrhL n=1 Tax=Luteibacter jiangsuensis TaxID=637577 RepID=A0ABT9T045_9GAMM|nr:acyltransferase family protein [Luteibacter jiangsuensis]MDQ0010636.1 peptidoglycan/LPS O-acetylase OafA/YrhL [Luteibacter jiangsuensis]